MLAFLPLLRRRSLAGLQLLESVSGDLALSEKFRGDSEGARREESGGRKSAAGGGGKRQSEMVSGGPK